jgi:hypothetical protein
MTSVRRVSSLASIGDHRGLIDMFRRYWCRIAECACYPIGYGISILTTRPRGGKRRDTTCVTPSVCRK